VAAAVASASFEELFGRPPEAAADAPGRVNLIGEHTDYNDGFVLPCAIPQRTRVELARRDDERVRAWSSASPEETPATNEVVLGAECRGRGWLDYVQGVWVALREQGLEVGGSDIRITSSVPPGSGLSSSAALTVSLLRVIRLVWLLPLDDVELALVAQRVENGFVGAPVGVMDPLACSLAVEGAALFVDTRSLEYVHVPLPSGLALLVLDSGVTHRHASGEYAVRRHECELAAAALGVRSLRECDLDDLPRIEALSPVLARRARHVVTENHRVLDAVDALQAGDLAALGALLSQSHRSLRDDYEVSVPAVDRLVALGERQPEVHGARITGGGFGGAVVMAADAGAAAELGQRIVEQARQEGGAAQLLVPQPPSPQPRGPSTRE